MQTRRMLQNRLQSNVNSYEHLTKRTSESFIFDSNLSSISPTSSKTVHNFCQLDDNETLMQLKKLKVSSNSFDFENTKNTSTLLLENDEYLQAENFKRPNLPKNYRQSSIQDKRHQICTLFDSNGAYTIFNLSTGNFNRNKEGNIYYRPLSKYLYSAILYKNCLQVNNESNYHLLTQMYLDGQIINKITLYSLENNSLIKQQSNVGIFKSMAICQGKMLTCNERGNLYEWSINDLSTPFFDWGRVHSQPIHNIICIPEINRLFTFHYDNVLQEFDLSQKKLIKNHGKFPDRSKWDCLPQIKYNLNYLVLQFSKNKTQYQWSIKDEICNEYSPKNHKGMAITKNDNLYIYQNNGSLQKYNMNLQQKVKDYGRINENNFPKFVDMVISRCGKFLQVFDASNCLTIIDIKRDVILRKIKSLGKNRIKQVYI